MHQSLVRVFSGLIFLTGTSASAAPPPPRAPVMIAPAPRAALPPPRLPSPTPKIKSPLMAKLTPFSETVLEDGIKDPERVLTDQKFAQAFAENYLIRLYDQYMESYMTEHKLTEPPVPFSMVKPLIDSANKVPQPVLVEMINSRFGSNLLITVLMSEIRKYEVKSGVSPTIPTNVVELRPAGIDEALKALDSRMSKLESAPVSVSTGFSTREMIIAGIAALSLLLSLFTLFKRE